MPSALKLSRFWFSRVYLTMLQSISKQLCEVSGMSHCKITGNGTSAIYLALLASGIPRGSYIAVPNISCPDPVYALIWAGYKPYFVDVNITDYNIDVDQFAEVAKAKKIRGLIAIHLFGNPCEIDKLRDICDKQNLFMVEDCAQALGNTYKGRPLGSFGDVSVFSFGNGKIAEVGHGGSVQTNDAQLLSKIDGFYAKLADFDAQKIAELSKKHRYFYYKIYNLTLKFPRVDILNLIFVYRFKKYYLYRFDQCYLPEISTQLGGLDENRSNRVLLVNKYIEKLRNIAVQLPVLHEKSNALSRLTVKTKDSERVSALLRDQGLSSNTMYPPLVSRFKLFYNKDELNNSFGLKGLLLNIWTNPINVKAFEKTVSVLKKETYE